MHRCSFPTPYFPILPFAAHLFLPVLVAALSIGFIAVYFYTADKLSTLLGKDSVMGKAIATLARRIAWMHLIALIVMPACESSNESFTAFAVSLF